MGGWRARIALLVAVAASLAPAWAGADEARVPLPAIEAPRAGTRCIADNATMRRDHPSMLMHQRDATVHGGIRGAKASLKGCIDCHASAKTGSVLPASIPANPVQPSPADSGWVGVGNTGPSRA